MSIKGFFSMRFFTPARKETYLKITLGIAVAILVILCGLLVREYRTLRRLNYLGAHQSLLGALHAHGAVGANDADMIQTWMTFDYVNHVFSLPPAYLASILAIGNSRYPRITIAEYAGDTGAARAAFLARVQDAVRAYFSPQQ
jgi:hypothetical protein